MSNKSVIGIIIGIIVIVGLVWWSLGRNKTEPLTPATNNEQMTQPTSITVNHYFQETNGTGKHTIEGSMTLPTPCHTLSSGVTVAESMPEQVTIAFTTVAGTGVCTQVLADKFFSVSFDASREAVIRATLNGAPLELIFSETTEGITK